MDQKKRCPWAAGDLMLAYHDREWGVPQHDDRVLFEFLVLEGAQAGLSWSTILGKRDNYRAAYHRFDPARVARFGAREVAALMTNPGIVRNRLKIEASIGNAKAFGEVQKEFGSFDSFYLAVCPGEAVAQRMARCARGARLHAAIRRDEPRASPARLPLRWVNYLLCVHAGGGDGERPSRDLLPIFADSLRPGA
jgi:DNA-3-methyladenine glycosylase I